MRIYFAGSIRGGRDDADLYSRIIGLLKEHGDVLTEHVGDSGLPPTGEERLTDEAIFQRDVAWLEEADVIVAEVSIPSHGVGYEIGRAEASGKPVLCIYRRSGERRLSAMLGGNPALVCRTYESLHDLEAVLQAFLDDARDHCT